MILLLACDLGSIDLGPVEPAPSADEVTASPTPDGCVTASVACGDTVEDHTRGGHSAWSNDHYRTLFCWSIHHDWDGPERIYRLELPEQTVAEVGMVADQDLDLFALSWPHEGCPSQDHSVSACEADVGSGASELVLVTQERAQTWLIAVDGKHAAEGAFRLDVECTPR